MGTATNDSNDIAFTCVCKEPEGDVIRTVRNIPFTIENLQKLFIQAKKFPTFMGAELNSFDDFIRFFVNEVNGNVIPKGLLMVVDDFIGVFWLTDIIGLNEASVHYTFFDRRHKGRVDLCKKALEYCFKTFQFHRLYTFVPQHADFVALFVKTLGFVQVGRLRQNRLYKGRFYDTFIFDLLQQEFINGLIIR